MELLKGNGDWSLAKRRLGHGWEVMDALAIGGCGMGKRKKQGTYDRYNSALITVLTAKQQRFAIRKPSKPGPVLARGRLLC